MTVQRARSRCSIGFRSEEIAERPLSIADAIEEGELRINQHCEKAVIFVKSNDGEAFEVEIRPLDSSGNPLGEIGPDEHSELSSSNSTVSTSVDLPSPAINVVIRDTGGSAHNRVAGSLRFV